MINRVPLKAKEKIQDRYTIIRQIGEGASSIVYDANFVDDRLINYKVRIKECFPLGSAFSREEGGKIICSPGHENSFISQKDKFFHSYERMVNLRNKESLANFIVTPRGFFDANNTVYSVFAVDQGKDYETILKQNTKNKNFGTLREVFVRFKKIVSVINQFHKEGFLCLDIKPQNILIVNTFPETVKLFDFDSFASKKDVQNDSLEYVSFSHGFAAPEQLTGARELISERTDIYAIGAMMYYVLFGEAYDCIDEIHDSDIKYNTMLFPDYQPELVNELKLFFSKTLAIWPEDRFSNMDEVSSQIEYLEYTSTSLFHPSAFSWAYNNSDEYNTKLKFLSDELKVISKDVNEKSLPRFLVLAKILGRRKPNVLNLPSVYKNSVFMKYVADICKKNTDNPQEAVDNSYLRLWALYNLVFYIKDVSFQEQLDSVYKQICDNKLQSEFVTLIMPYVDKKISSFFNEKDVFDFMKEIIHIVAQPHNAKNLITTFELALKKCSYGSWYYVVLSLFASIFLENEVDGNVATYCEREKNGFVIRKYRKEYLFSEAVKSYAQSGFRDKYIVRLIKYVADEYGYNAYVNLDGFNRKETIRTLFARFPKFMSAVAEYQTDLSGN